MLIKLYMKKSLSLKRTNIKTRLAGGMTNYLNWYIHLKVILDSGWVPVGKLSFLWLLLGLKSVSVNNNYVIVYRHSSHGSSVHGRLVERTSPRVPRNPAGIWFVIEFHHPTITHSRDMTCRIHQRVT